MFHSFVQQELQRFIIHVVPNFYKRHGSINLFLHVVILIPRVEIVDIPHCHQHGFRVNDPSTLFHGRVCFLLIRLIIDVIVPWQEISHDIIFYLGFWWIHPWEFHWVLWRYHSWEIHWVFCREHSFNLSAGYLGLKGYSGSIICVLLIGIH